MAALLLEDAQVAPKSDAAVIGEQNDIFRRHLGFAAMWKNQPLTGQILMTPGITALPEVQQIAIMREVINFRDFNAENDPWGDHGFGVVEGPCCANRVRDSLREFSVIAGRYEQLGPYEVQDHELVGLQ